MAEGSAIDGILGGESEPEDTAPVAGVDAVALALALQATRHDPELSRSASDYLAQQRALVILQLKHFDEERHLAIAAAKRKRISDRLRIGLQLFVVLLALGALVGLAAMFWDALTDHGINIQAFAVPSDLAGKGLTGQVVAKKVLDRIADLDHNTFTVRAASSFTINWGNDLKVEVPETGISIGEISRWIHERFGHATRIDGEVYHTSSGVTVSIRVGAEPAIETVGAEADLVTLIQEAATRVYAATQPYRYGFWLATHDRPEESNAIFRRLITEGSAVDRIWALHGLAINQESPEKQIAFEQQALEANPHFILSEFNVENAERDLGHGESALAKALAAIADEQGFADETLSPAGRALMRDLGNQDRDTLLGDYQSATTTDSLNADAALPVNFITAGRMALQLANLTLLHDTRGAQEILDLLPAPITQRAAIRRSAILSALDAERGDWAAALAQIDQSTAADPVASGTEFHLRNPVLTAEVYARSGRNAEADAIIAALAPDNYNRWRARGRVAIFRRDYAGGAQALAEAVRLAPSIPLAYNDWGDALFASGDLPGAIAKYRDANQRGPHWADPLKAWGDVLAKQGHPQDALQKYDEALKYAPNWHALKAARELVGKAP